jgi:hypothetical protein
MALSLASLLLASSAAPRLEDGEVTMYEMMASPLSINLAFIILVRFAAFKDKKVFLVDVNAETTHRSFSVI